MLKHQKCISSNSSCFVLSSVRRHRVSNVGDVRQYCWATQDWSKPVSLTESEEGLLQLVNPMQNEESTGAASVATCINSTTRLCHQVVFKFINHPINTFNVLGGIWDPTDNKFTLLPAIPDLDLALEACKAFPKESTTCIWFIQGHKVCNSRTRLQTVPML